MSTIKVDTIKNTSNVEVYTAKAWVNFDGTTNTGGSCTIRASGNVSSVTDNGTGDYTVNFTTAMSDANYATVCSGMRNDRLQPQIAGPIQTPSTTAVRVAFESDSGNFLDASEFNAAIFR